MYVGYIQLLTYIHTYKSKRRKVKTLCRLHAQENLEEYLMPPHLNEDICSSGRQLYRCIPSWMVISEVSLFVKCTTACISMRPKFRETTGGD